MTGGINPNNFKGSDNRAWDLVPNATKNEIISLIKESKKWYKDAEQSYDGSSWDVSRSLSGREQEEHGRDRYNRACKLVLSHLGFDINVDIGARSKSDLFTIMISNMKQLANDKNESASEFIERLDKIHADYCNIINSAIKAVENRREKF